MRTRKSIVALAIAALVGSLGVATSANASPSPRLSLSTSTLTVHETNANYTVSSLSLHLRRRMRQDVVVPLIWSFGSALRGSDAIVPDSVTIPAGARSAAMPITIVGDTAPEPTETFGVKIGDAGIKIEQPSHATITILDDDAPVPGSLVIQDATISAGTHFETHWIPPTVAGITGYEVNVVDTSTLGGTLLVHLFLDGTARSARATLASPVAPGTPVKEYVQPFSPPPTPDPTGQAAVQLVDPVGAVPSIDFMWSCAPWMGVRGGTVPGATSYTAVFHNKVTGEDVERTAVVPSTATNFEIDNDGFGFEDGANWSASVTANPSDGSPAVVSASPRTVSCTI